MSRLVCQRASLQCKSMNFHRASRVTGAQGEEERDAGPVLRESQGCVIGTGVARQIVCPVWLRVRCTNTGREPGGAPVRASPSPASPESTLSTCKAATPEPAALATSSVTPRSLFSCPSTPEPGTKELSLCPRGP
uniref:Uncharacterized protein n=1 Tax=Rousettus aegyptiacus TaxID=9407 RepID=A0A7J8CIW2_ROUAE|nr:hypothetical protein HJG63_009214 [Rousettus aegyptiacus]